MKNVPVPSLRSVCTLVLLTGLVLASAAGGQTSPPSFTKSFNPSTIGPDSVSTLRFEISTESGVRNAAFTDDLPAGMTIASPANPFLDCVGTLSAPDGGTTIELSGANVASSCEITVDVTSSTPGTHTNTTSDLTWEDSLGTPGTSDPAVADLIVATDRPGFTKSFSPPVVLFGGRSTLTFTIDNSLNTAGAVALNFIDNLPAGMVVADPANASDDCAFAPYIGGDLTAVPGTSVISLSGFSGIAVAAVDAASSCTVSVDVEVNFAGVLGNTTEELFSSPLPTGSSRSSGKAAATVTGTVDKIVLEKSFIDDPVAPGGTVTLELTIRNLDRNSSATGISFTDDLDAVVSGLEAISLPASPCGAGSSLTGTGFLTFAGGELAASTTCTFSAVLQVPAVTGTFTNTTSQITADVGGRSVTGDPASDMLFVQPVPLFTKTFIGDPVGAGDSIDLEFSITNTSPSSTATAVAFIDELTTFLPFPISAVLPGPDPCGAGSDLSVISLGTEQLGLALTGGTLAGGATCTFTVTLDLPEGLASRTYTNVTDPITATIDGVTVTGGSASDSFDLVAAPSLLKEFVGDPVPSPGTVTLQFTLSHGEEAPGDATDIAFSDNLAGVFAGLTATDTPLLDVCGAGSEIDGTTDLMFSGGTLQPGESCTFSVTLSVPAGVVPGAYTNTTSNVVATVLGVVATSNTASDDLDVAGLELTKEFTDDPVIPGDTVNLLFTVANTSGGTDATEITFSDSLSAVLANLTTVPSSFVLNDVCGAGSSLTSAGTSLTFQNGSLAAGDPACTFDVTLQVPAAAEAGTYLNRTSGFQANVMSFSLVSFENATDELVVVSDFLVLTKEFTDDPVGPGDEVTLRFTLTNLSATDPVADVAFSDDLEVVISGLEATGLPAAACGGTVSGTSTISFSGGSLTADETCSFDVTLAVPEEAAGGTIATNVTSGVTGTLGGLAVTGDEATDELLIDANDFSKAFGGDAQAGGTVSLTFDLFNLDDEATDTGLRFSDNLDSVIPGLTADGLPLVDVCGDGSLVEAVDVEGETIVQFSGGSLLPGGSCTFTFDVVIPEGTEPGDYVNVTSDLLQEGARAAGPATDTFTVTLPPAFSKGFTPDSIDAGAVSTLTLVIDNTGSPIDAGDLDFTDTFPAGLVIADPSNASTDCTGTLTAAAGTGTVTLTGGSVGAGESCSVTVDVTSDTPGAYDNVTGDLTSSLGNSGTAPATLTVLTVGDPDADGDGVPDGDDFCADTVIPEGVPTTGILKPNRYALMDADFIFDTNGGNLVFTTADTAGCSCEQIIEELGLGNGQRKFGCSKGNMRRWVRDMEDNDEDSDSEDSDSEDSDSEDSDSEDSDSEDSDSD